MKSTSSERSDEGGSPSAPRPRSAAANEQRGGGGGRSPSRSPAAASSSKMLETSFHSAMDNSMEQELHGYPQQLSAFGTSWQASNDDSFSDERFMSPSSLPGGSWESQSFDSEDRRGSSRPSSRMSLRDRRKRLDTTTPTLIDEEDEEELSSSFERSGLGSVDDLRRRTMAVAAATGNTAYFKSALEEGEHQSLQQQEAMQSMRRTPGASQMHLSIRGSEMDSDASGLSFGLKLPPSSTPTDEGAKGKPKARTWQSIPAAAPTPPPGVVVRQQHRGAELSESDQGMRPPAAPSTPASVVGSQTTEAKSPYTFASWARTKSPQGETSAPGNPETRHGAFSPNILRLTEDIGNLLNEEDEDDVYAREIPIPNVYRGNDETLPELGDVDWTRSYAFGPKFVARSSRGFGQRSSTFVREGRTRRRSSSSQGYSSQASPFPPNAQQPMPRRVGNELFEFGKTRDERESPQLVNFSGAFAPPARDVSGSFLRPVASAQVPAAPFAPLQPQPDDAQPPPSFGNAPAGSSFGFQQPQTFNSFQSSVPQGNFTGTFQPNRFASPSPILVPPGGYPVQHQHHSDMHATAQEFVPMSTRSPTPQQIMVQAPTQWTQLQHPSHAHNTAIDQGSRHSGSTSYHSYSPNFGYGMPPQNFGDVRAAMTPSPHLPPWPQPQPPPPPPSDPSLYAHPAHPPPDPSLYAHTAHPPSDPSLYAHTAHPTSDPSLYAHAAPPIAPIAAMEAASPVFMPPSTPQPTASSPEQQYREKNKKDTRRGGRGRSKKEKKKPDKFASGGKKKSNKGEMPRPESTTQSQDGNADDLVVSASEDPVDAKRAELVESPATRSALKDFYRVFRIEERLSFQKAEEHALEALENGSLPESVHWKVYLELADLAKRSNRYVEARHLYQKVCQLQPYASQGWLEYSKLEEECGFMNRVTNILHYGIEHCEHSESLLTRAVKHQEKMGNLGAAREILARLKHTGIDKVWKTVLEGALLEARDGNRDLARRVLKYLMHHVPWYGPLYLEAFKLERDQGHPMDALQVVQWGLNALPRYGPLWFGAFRLYEEMDVTEKLYRLPNTLQMTTRAITSISKELVWKIHLDAALMLERTAIAHVMGTGEDFESYLKPVRHRLVLTVLTCPNNLRWKVWLVAGRIELGVGRIDAARLLFRRAHGCVQRKSKSATLLECARLEEFVGDTELARAILCKARLDYGNDWKVWLESVLIEMRNDNNQKAFEIATSALDIHIGTGRLWATLVQLSQLVGGDKAQGAALERALREVPKSGEVWCEGGRVHLNPFSRTFDLDRARRHLFFASKFTPQFGDSFVESVRLEILSHWLMPVAMFVWRKTKHSYLQRATSDPDRELVNYMRDVILALTVARRKQLVLGEVIQDSNYRTVARNVRKRLRVETLRSATDLTDLRLSCVNADPNYGSLWFYCRRLPTDTPRRIIEHAAEDVADEVFKHAHVYVAAIVRRIAVLTITDIKKPKQAKGTVETDEPLVVEWENAVDQRLRVAPPLEDICSAVKSSTGLEVLEEGTDQSAFVAGLSELNKHRPIGEMDFSERRKALFGTDALFP